MVYDNENLDFDAVSFDSEEECAGINIHLTNDGDITLNLCELNDGNDIPVSVNLIPKSTAKIAEDIEEVILNLLESGDRETLLYLTGERPDLSSNLDNNLHMDFAALYSQAVIYNPAIKWYSRLANILPRDQFFVQNGQLHMKMPSKTFKKVILPFIGDFNLKFADCSPIVQLVLNCSEKIASKYVEEAKEKIKPLIRHKDEAGLNIEDAGLELFFMTDDTQYAGSEMRVDDNDSLNQSGVREVQASFKFADMSNKAIASYCVKHKLTDQQVNEKLSENIADKARKNEISVLVGLARKLNNSPLQQYRAAKYRENPDKDSFRWD